ncbi:accessory Sec system protein Asp3 [Streptococcus cameli]
MGKILIKKIEWPYVRSGQSYLYGSKVSFEENETLLHNPRLAAGKPLRTFQSRTNYQGNRSVPDLPALIPGKKYAIELDMETTPPLRYFVQIMFYNRQGEIVETTVLREGEEEFACPEDTFTYTVYIRSAGCYTLSFRSLSILKIAEPSDTEVLPIVGKYKSADLPNELELVRNFIELD